MNDENKKAKKTCETIEVVEGAIVVYIEGQKELFDVVQITDRGVIIGRILKINKKERPYVKCREVFMESGFIPSGNIIRIEGGTRRKICKQKS